MQSFPKPLLLALVLLLPLARGQTDRAARDLYRQAEGAYESANYTSALQLIAEIEEALASANPMTLAMRARISAARGDHEGLQRALDAFFAVEAHPELADEMLVYAARLDKLRNEELVADVKRAIVAQEEEQQAMETFRLEHALATSLTGEFAYASGDSYYFFRPSDRSYARIRFGNLSRAERFVSEMLPPQDWYLYSEFVRNNSAHYLKAKLRPSTYLTPGYDNGYVRAKPNRAYNTSDGLTTLYVFETGTDVLVRDVASDADARQMDGDWLIEDPTPDPTAPYPRNEIETGRFEIIADTPRIKALAAGEAGTTSGFYQIQLQPARKLSFVPTSRVQLRYEGKVKAHLVSTLSNPGFKARERGNGYVLGAKEKAHHFKKVDRKLNWDVRAVSTSEAPYAVDASGFMRSDGCWEIRTANDGSSYRNAGCDVTNPYLASEYSDLLDFLLGLSELEEGETRSDLFGDELTIELK